MKNNAIVLYALIGGLGACGAADSGNVGGSASKSDAGGYKGASADAALGIPNFGAGGSAGSGAGAATPPEQETKVDYLTPRGGDLRVYVANPTRNTVSIINSDTLTISEQPTGDTPTYVATVPGQDIALVINAGSHTLRVIREDTPGAKSYPIVSRANTISLSPDGLHAVVWFDSSQNSSSTSSTTTTAGTTQGVSLVSLGSGTTADSVVSVTVGYNPSTVVFSSDSSAAFVVTDDGISELRFANITGPTIAPFTRIDDGSLTLLSADAGTLPTDSRMEPDLAPPGPDASPVPDGGVPPMDGGSRLDSGEPDIGKTPDAGTAAADATVFKDASPSSATAKGKAVDVSVSRNGDYAIARREGSAAVLLVDLKAKTVSTLLLSSEVTDLDLVDGAISGPQAFAVLRSESRLVRIDIPAGFSDESHRKDWPFAGALIGSVTMSAKGTYALLYTTAIPSKDLAVFDLVKEQLLPQQPELHKNIRAVAIAPDEKTALVLHSKSASTSTSTALTQQEIDDQSYGYSIVQLATGSTLLQTTTIDPSQFAITPDSSSAFVLLRDDKASIRKAQEISLANFSTRDFPLGSPPSSIAALSSAVHKVFIGQEYSEGRISFIDWITGPDTGSVQSVTGFALNGRIQQ